LITQRNRLRGVLDALVDGIYIVGRQHEIEYINGVLEHEFGPVSGRKCYAYTYDRTEPCPWCRKSEVPTGGPARREWDSSRTGKTYELFETPIIDSEGSVARLKIFHDVTQRKRALEEVQNSREQLRNLSAHLQAAREEERTAISREIHDELGQVLATLQLDISWLVGGLHDDQKHLAEKASLMSGLIERTVRTVQRISSELRPPLLDELGLADALEWQAKEFQKRSAISCEIAVELEGSTIERHVSTALYRIFQEALTNVLRHAGATRVEASLTERGGKVVLMVRDNGRGITREQHGDPLSIGLIGMRERTRMLGGKIKILGEEWKGTAIIVRIPVPRREE
jgi:signal transduction histidine kinase